MGRTGLPDHENRIREVLSELEKQGYRTINLHGKSPDGIAVKDNRVIAVDVITQRMRSGKKKFDGGITFVGKKRDYSALGFDDVLIDILIRGIVHSPSVTTGARIPPVEQR